METEKMISLYGGTVTIKFNPGNHSYWLTNKKPMERLCGVTTHIGVLDKPALVPWAVGLTVDYIRDHIELLKNGEIEPDQLFQQARNEADKQRDLAAEIGTAIHGWIESHIKGEEPDMPEDAKVLQGVLSFLDWVNDQKVEFLWSERIIYSKKHNYVGTADFGIKIGKNGLKGKRFMGDIKTGNGIYAEVKQQTAAYMSAITEESGEKYDGRWVLRISKETEEQYMAKMEKKMMAGKIKSIPPFKVFEALFLDNDPKSFDRDFKAYLSSKNEYEWKKVAEAELRELKNSN